MQLPNLPQDKANHAFWDDVLDCGVDKEAVEASLASQIALQKNPVTTTGTT